MFRNYIFIAFALLNTLLLKAQVAFDSNVQLDEGEQPPLPGDPESNLWSPGSDVPVDQYVYVLLVLTVAFGVFYFYKNKKSKINS